MKLFKMMAVAFAAITFFSCQKEIGFDANGVSSGTLKSSTTGDCLPQTLYGIYRKDSVLTTDNYMDVQVSVTIAGTFDIRSDTVNGYSFSKTGNVGTGLNTIRLYASGKPLAAGTNTFTIKYGGSQCKFNVTVITRTAGGAIFTLGGAPGNCSGFTASGTYTAGVAMSVANTVTMLVNVSAGGTGTYMVTTNVVNGVSFAASGTFTNAGVQNISLTATGTPLANGAFNYTVSSGSSNCGFSITYAPAGPIAVFTLGGSPLGCTGVTLNGSYAVGSSLTSANNVKMDVNVTTAGSYAIATTTVDGFSFSAAGTFSATGAQTVTLVGSGSPTASGNFNFPATGNASTCTFSVTVTGAPNPDYYPLTLNSWWSYDEFLTGIPSIDSVKNTVIRTATYNGAQYYDIEETQGGVINDTARIRKAGNNYYLWGRIDALCYQVQFDNIQLVDHLFLQENAATNTTWSSLPLSGTIGGNAATIRYDFKIVNANTSISVNGITYNNVIHMSYDVQLSLMGNPFTLIETDENYFAKGIGPLKPIFTQTGGAVMSERDIRHFQIF